MGVVRGTTCSRFRCLLAASLLTMTAGLSLRTSPPIAGSKLTHHTSARFIGDISDRCLGPGQRLGFACFVAGHRLVSRLQLVTDYVGTHERFDKLADPPPPNRGVQ